MEKYSQWRDAGTGVAPFLPVKVRLPVISPAIAVLRLLILVIPGFIITMALYIALPIADFQKKMFKVQLWLLGLSKITEEYSDNEGRFRSQQKSASLPKPGDVLVSNFVSPLDPLLFASILDCVFVIPYGPDKYAQISLSEAMSSALLDPKALADQLSKTKNIAFDDIVETARKHGQVVVVFCEGTTTNGKGVLTLKPLPVSRKSSLQVYPTALKYTPAELTSPIPQSFISWAWTTLSRLSFVNVRVRFGLPKQYDQSDTYDTKKLQADIASAGKLTTLGLSLADKSEFLAQWMKKH